ncbi:MAG: class I SAM-dependent methyltransferase [Planctomycetota bacterium]
MLAQIGRPWTTRTHDTDLSERCTYSFNSLGYRGPEFDSTRRFVAYVFGESDAFGTGVEWHETWAVRAALGAAAKRDVEPDDVMVMNFAESGASNAYIARALVSQVAHAPPDLVLVGLADHERIEIVTDGGSMSCGGWFRSAASERFIDEADLTDREEAGLRDGLRRGRAYLEFVGSTGDAVEQGAEPQRLYETLRSLLLMQGQLAAAGIPAVAVGRGVDRLLDAEARQHPVLGSLCCAISPSFLMSRSLEAAAGEHRGCDGIHLDRDQHALVAEAAVRHLQSPPDSWPWELERDESRGPAGASVGPSAGDRVTERVAAFYDELPFNFHGSEAAAEKAIEVPSVATHFLDLDRYLRDNDGLRVFEVGCGAGWLAHGLSIHHGARVDAVDLSRSAVDRARRMGERLGTQGRVRIEQADILSLDRPDRFDLAISMGVLHHTSDPRLALANMVAHLKPGGHVYLGLYHGPGRRVFLDEMGRILRKKGEKAAFRAYRKLDGVHAGDETLARSWFRDQVLHPHETQHTLREVVGWFDELGVELVSTSINGFYPLGDLAALYEQELSLAEVSRRALFEEKRYYPGFFTVFGRSRA